MNIQDIANRLVELCRKGEFESAQKELYAQDAKSYEPEGWGARETVGLEAIFAKGEVFRSGIAEYHNLAVSDPIVATNSFACIVDLDATMKNGTRMPMKELCLYTVADGKIVREEFFS